MAAKIQQLAKFICVCLIATLLITFLLSLQPVGQASCQCQDQPISTGPKMKNRKTGGKLPTHNLAVLVPFRDRLEELLQFAPYMHKFLNEQGISHKIFVLHQVDNHRFNRASLINIGFLVSRNAYDYMAMHDVDLLPLNPELRYDYPETGPYHIASPDFHPRYHYATFVGGILLVRREHFEAVNGLSNKYWGWGLEDDEFYARLKVAGLNITRPQNLSTGTHNSFRHIHDRRKRPRDMAKLYNQKKETRKLDRETGASTVRYKIVSQQELTIDGAPLAMINIELECDYDLTPWCDHETTTRTKKSAPT